MGGRPGGGGRRRLLGDGRDRREGATGASDFSAAGAACAAGAGFAAGRGTARLYGGTSLAIICQRLFFAGESAWAGVAGVGSPEGSVATGAGRASGAGGAAGACSSACVTSVNDGPPSDFTSSSLTSPPQPGRPRSVRLAWSLSSSERTRPVSLSLPDSSGS